MCNLNIISAILLLAVATANVESRTTEELAKKLCRESWHPHKITSLSTIYQLADYFRSEAVPSELASCRDQYQEPLQDFKAILEAGKVNICSDHSIDLIYNFHWDYIVGSLSRKWRKASPKTIPDRLRKFFMQYAEEVTDRCKDSLASRLEVSAAGQTVQSEEFFRTSFGINVENLSAALVPQNRVKNYDTFLLVWNQAITRERKAGRDATLDVDPQTGEPTVGVLKFKDPTRFWTLQQKCRRQFRPVYLSTVLPVMRLLEMGYGKVDESSEQVVKSQPQIGNWYALTQFCEMVLPLSFYRDDTLKEGQYKILSDAKDAIGLVGMTEAEGALGGELVVPEVKPLVLDGDMIHSAANDNIVKQVKKNLRERNRLFKQFIKNISGNLKGQLRQKLKDFFVVKKTKDNQLIEQRGDEIAQQSESELNEILEDDSESLAPSAGGRVKRRIGFWDIFLVFVIVMAVVLVLGTAGCVIAGVTILGISLFG